MNNKTYSLDIVHNNPSDSRIITILTSLRTWFEQYWPNYINFIETEVVTWKFLWKVNTAKNIFIQIKSEIIFSQICWVAWVEFNKEKLKYSKDLL